MRRIALAILLVLAAAAGTAVAANASGSGSGSARFDVIFDDARGLVAGQLVKIAGAQAGTILNVVVTPDFKARVEATVESRFMPFHRDATCAIRPEGLIAENFVDCDPGTPSSPPLRGSGGHPPTVPVQNTSEPVSLLDLFNIFNVPTRERLQVLVDELGIATAGRGDDFNSILQRANPALGLARQAISILTQQSAQLKTILDATTTILAQAASHRVSLQRFLSETAALTGLTAAHRGPLAEDVARLPGLLAAAQPALSELDTVARDGTPLVSQIESAVPALNRASADLGPFVRTATPALARLTTALRQAIPAVQAASPLVSTLRRYAARSAPNTGLFARVAENLQQHGFVENFLKVAYSVAASLSRHDAISHMLSIMLVGPDNGACGNYATTPIPACNAHYGQNPAYTPQSAATASKDRGTSKATRSRPKSHATAGGTRSTRATSGGSHGSRSATRTPATRATPAKPAPATPSAPAAPGQSGIAATAQTLQNLINYLIK